MRRAEVVAYEVSKLGAMPLCPHANTRPYFVDGQAPEFWLDGTLELMRRCDAILLMQNWLASAGSRAERDEAKRLGIPVFESTLALAAWLREEA